jgi:hypothetical protein
MVAGSLYKNKQKWRFLPIVLIFGHLSTFYE